MSRWARHFCRTARCPRQSTALQEATRLEPANGEANYQLGLALARAGRKEDAAAALQKGRELVAADDRNQQAASMPRRAGGAAEGRPANRRKRSSGARIELRPDSSEAKRDLEALLQSNRVALTVRGADADRRWSLSQADVAAEASEVGTASTAADAVDDPGVAELEGYIRDGKFAEVEPLLADVRQGAAVVLLGLVRARLQPVRARRRSATRSRRSRNRCELDVRNAEAHKILGRSLMMIGRFDAAQVEFEQAIRYKPDSAEMHYNLGKLFSIQDNWEPARKAFEAALRVDPSYVEALDALGLALEALGDDAGAVATYEKAIALNDQRQGTFAGASREPERVLQPHGQSRQGARVRDEGAGDRSEIGSAPFSRKRAPTSARAGSTTRSTR